MSNINELKKDSMEFEKILELVERKRVRDVLLAAKADIDKEIGSMELKMKHMAEQKNTETKRYCTELTEYAWDQSDKFVKLFISLNGVQQLDEAAVVIKLSPNALQLSVHDLNGKDYRLEVNNLLEPIDTEKSYRKIKTDMVAIYLKKATEKHWSHLTSIEKRLKDKEDSEMKSDPENANDAILNIMKKMYQSGDTKTKQMIAKAFTESQEKMYKNDIPEY